MTDSKEMNWSDYDEILGTIQRKKERQTENLLDNSSLTKKDDRW
jgi:hypothetical protein